MDLTVVVGLDAATLEQWKLSLPTIVANRPALLECPWCVFYDRDAMTHGAVFEVARNSGLTVVDPFPWPSQPNRYETQRGKMLAGFVHVPRYGVKTTHWMKIDTDVVATQYSGPWFHQEWFQNGNVLAASPWGYTKTKGGGGTATEWAESLESFGDAMILDSPRLNLVRDVRGTNKIIHKRFWSPVSFYETQFTTLCSELCEMHCGDEQTPVPSQDTTHWYIAKRAGLPYKTVNMKRLGWKMCANTKQLVGAARDALPGVHI